MAVVTEKSQVENIAQKQLSLEEQLQDLRPVEISNKSYCFIKRMIDIVVSVLGIAVLLVPFVLVAIVVYIDDPGTVIFSQKRVGHKGEHFRLYKFRTMKKETPKYMATSDVDDPTKYITRVGKILRKLSLDEIPQLLNVLKGDMSLVGPRPLIPNEEDIHAMRERFGVYEVRPGVTGLAQVNGRDLVLPADKVRYDVRYIENFGFWMDVKILFATVPKVFSCVGVIEGHGDSRKK